MERKIFALEVWFITVYKPIFDNDFVLVNCEALSGLKAKYRYRIEFKKGEAPDLLKEILKDTTLFKCVEREPQISDFPDCGRTGLEDIIRQYTNHII
jgi:hypothetical protein